MAVPPVFNFVEWVKENEHLLKPPVNNRMMYSGDDFIVMVVGGPNQRSDFHVDPYEEWFYQVRGNMHVNVGSVGIVIERIRKEGTLEKFRWYCPNCNACVHEVELQVRNIVEDLPPVFEAFYGSEQARTCPQCGTVHPGKG